MNKYKKLIISLIADAVGLVSYLFPGVAELSDVIWAPVAAWLMTKLYKGPAGKVGAIIAFAEEILPNTDIIPSFTLMWIYTYVLKKEKDVPK